MSGRMLADSIKAIGAGEGWEFDAVVDAVDPARGTVSVTIQPTGVEVDGLLYFTPLTAGPWIWMALPKVGTSVKVSTTDPNMINADTAYVKGALWDEDDTPPEGYEAGDVLLVHENGTSRFLLKADGTAKLYGGTVELGDDAALALCNSNMKDFLSNFITALNAQLDLLKFHTHATVPVDPTLVPLGGLTGPDGSTLTSKVTAT